MKIPAIAVHHTATTDEPWDGPAAVAAMPSDDAVLRYCHAWQTAEAADEDHKSGDDDADDQKGSYKFPHHKTKGGPANLAACRNGLARLDGAKIPDADRAGVKAHLQAHLDDAEKKGGDGGGKSTDHVGFPLVDQVAWARAGHLGNLCSEDRVRERAVRAHAASDNTEFFRITNHDGDAATLDLYGDIGFWTGVTASDFNQQLKNITAQALTIHINSPGGDVFDGVAILNMLRAHPATKHVVVDGLAASAASFIAMAGNTITVMPGAMMMIHDASGGCMGNAAEMQQMSDLLDKVSDNIASIYAAKSGKGDTVSWRETMRAEQWYTADEAVEAGLADRVGDTDSPSDFKPPTDRWTLNFYNYAGRTAAPAPRPLTASPPSKSTAELANAGVDSAAVMEAAGMPVIPAVVPVLASAAPTPIPVPVEEPAPTTPAVADTAPAVQDTPSVEPAPVDDIPVWDAAVFQLALKERAATS